MLQDDHVRLRPWAVADVAALVPAVQDPDVVRHTLVPSPYSDEQARAFLELATGDWRDGRGAHFAVTSRAGGGLLGGISVHGVDGDPAVGQLGYWVARESRGRGVARRALALVSSWAADHYGHARQQLYIDADNAASRRVAEAARYEREGLLRSWRARRDGRCDAYVYARLPGDGTVVGSR